MDQEIKQLICHECQEHYWGQMDYCPHIGEGCAMLNASVEAVVQWAKKESRALVSLLDESNMLRHKSLEGTPDEGRHCGLLVPMEQWSELQAMLTGNVILEGR